VRKIVIATPCYGGVSADFANSLAASVNVFLSHGIHLFPMLLAHHSVIQMARNRLLAEAIKLDVDDIVWIDSDISWDPMDLMKLCLHEEDVVGATYRKKMPESTHFTLMLIKGNETPDWRGLVEVSRLGTGFLRMTKKTMKELFESSVEYIDSKGASVRNVFEVGLLDGEFLSEDFFVCEKLKKLGYKIMLDSKINLGHEGNFTYRGDVPHFLEWIKAGSPDQSEKK
jgi:GT2 family glycosyltransferase